MSNPLRHLWQGVLDGDQTAWRTLVRQLAPLVYSVSRRAGLDEADASDVTQQTWLALYRQRHQVRDPDKLTSWLTLVAKRKTHRRLRQRNRRREITAQVPEASNECTPEEELDQLERITLLRLALSRLDVRCRTLLEDSFFTDNELSYQQIANKLHISINSVGPTRLRCLKKLRRILRELGLD